MIVFSSQIAINIDLDQHRSIRVIGWTWFYDFSKKTNSCLDHDFLRLKFFDLERIKLFYIGGPLLFFLKRDTPWYYKITRNTKVVLDRVYQPAPLYSYHSRFNVYIKNYTYLYTTSNIFMVYSFQTTNEHAM